MWLQDIVLTISTPPKIRSVRYLIHSAGVVKGFARVKVMSLLGLPTFPLSNVFIIGADIPPDVICDSVDNNHHVAGKDMCVGCLR
jgi:hypothetical protein